MTSDLKTKPTQQSVTAFINSVENDTRRADAKQLLKIFKATTGMPAKMWGPSIIGFGTYHYRYESGREGDWMLAGFSPRKGNLALYIMSGFSHYEALLKKLGKHKTGASCLYINKLADIDPEVLRQLISTSVKYMQEKYPHSSR